MFIKARSLLPAPGLSYCGIQLPAIRRQALLRFPDTYFRLGVRPHGSDDSSLPFSAQRTYMPAKSKSLNLEEGRGGGGWRGGERAREAIDKSVARRSANPASDR